MVFINISTEWRLDIELSILENIYVYILFPWFLCEEKASVVLVRFLETLFIQNFLLNIFFVEIVMCTI